MTTLRGYLDHCLRPALGWVRMVPTKMTSDDRVAGLLPTLYPVSCPTGLIRLGPAGDGGYLLPNDLDGIEACFSPGVSHVSGFEADCAKRGMQVFLADRSVDGPAEDHERFHFTKKFIGVTSNEEFMTLDEWVDHSLAERTSDLLLQIDIEGYEYEVFLSTSPKLMSRFRVIVAEFHFLEMLWSEPFFNLASRAFAKILQTHSCVHLHPNNYYRSVTRAGIEIPRIMEFTFLRNDRIGPRSNEAGFPHPLDRDNTSKRTLPLPKCWYRGG